MAVAHSFQAFLHGFTRFMNCQVRCKRIQIDLERRYKGRSMCVLNVRPVFYLWQKKNTGHIRQITPPGTGDAPKALVDVDGQLRGSSAQNLPLFFCICECVTPIWNEKQAMQFCNPTIIRCFDARCGGIYPAPFSFSEVRMAMRFWVVVF